MVYQVVWSPTARLDLKDLCTFIAQHDARAAAKFACSIFESVERLANFPHSGRVVPEFGDPAIREVIHRPCRVVYRVKESKSVIEIARVWYAARGLPEV